MAARTCGIATLFVVLPALSAFAGQRQPGSGSAAPGTALSLPSSPSSTDPSPVTVRINAVVTDGRGRSLADLKAADFELDDNGVPQKLQSVELRSIATQTSAGAPIDTEAEEERAARDPGVRVIALFLDEFNVSPGLDSQRVRDTATRFINEQLRPRDLLYVMKPMGPVNAIRFTRDRAAALGVVQKFEGRKGNYEPRTAFERQYFGRTPAAVESARVQIVTTGLRELTMRMGELQAARGALVLVSEGFSRPGGAERRRLPDWQSLARAASHFNFPIYTIDPRDPQPAPSDSVNASPPDRNQVTLQTLAAQTGGEAVPDATGILPALARISRDLDTFYVLTYSPSQATDGRFHPIEVRAKRKDALVRAPSGYWSPLSSEWRSWLNRPSTPAPVAPTRALRRSRLIDVWYGFERGPDGRLQVVVTWEPSMAVPRAQSRPAAVGLKASTPDGAALFDADVAPVDPAGDESGTRDRAVFPVSAGRVELDLTIRSGDGATIETAAQDLDVPVFRGAGPVLLPPQLLRARTAREFRTLSAAPEAAPSPSRVFSRSDRLLIRVPAYNPDGAPIVVSVAVVNLRGQKIRELARVGEQAAAMPQFELPLAFLAPGEYGVEVTVTSPTGSSRQLVRFRLTG